MKLEHGRMRRATKAEKLRISLESGNLMESRMRANVPVRFGEGDGETYPPRDVQRALSLLHAIRLPVPRTCW